MRHLPTRRRSNSPTAMGRARRQPVWAKPPSLPQPALAPLLGGARPCDNKVMPQRSAGQRKGHYCQPHMHLEGVALGAQLAQARFQPGKPRRHLATNSGARSGAKGRSCTWGVPGGALRGCKASSALAVSAVKGQRPSDRSAMHKLFGRSLLAPSWWPASRRSSSESYWRLRTGG